MSTTTLDGTFNFRDVGGIPLTSGGAVRPGVLYRSDALSGLTADGLGQLAASNIGVIGDFRTPKERQMAPDRLPTTRPFRTVELSILEGAVTGAAQDAMQAGAQQDDPDAANAAMQEVLAQLPTLSDLYAGILQHGAPAFAEVARFIAASSDEHPTAVLVHCTAGKDRTGVCTALMLDAVGADRDAIVADYASSERHLTGPWAEGMYAMLAKMGVPLTDGLKALVASTPAQVMVDTLAWVDERGGSVAYLRAGGMTDDEFSALTQRLTA